MDSEDLKASLEDLSGNITDLEDSLTPLLDTALSTSTSKLPLLDKAKLYVLVTYAIESLLFSYIRLHGVEAKSHPVFRELSRVKQYFDKIKTAETVGLKPNTKLDKDAAGRFVKHALAGNEKYDKEREEQLQREKAGAKRKFEEMNERVGSHLRFEGLSKKTTGDDDGGLVREQESGDEKEGDAEGDGAASLPPVKLSYTERREKHVADKKAQRAERKRSKLEAKESEKALEAEPTETILPRKQKSKQPPKGHHEAFEGLLKGSLPKEEDKKVKRKRSCKDIQQKAEDKRAEEMM